MIGAFVGDWRWLAVRGVAAVLFGLLTLVWPNVTLWVLVVLWGAFVLVDGLAGLVAVLLGDVERHRGWWALAALVGIGVGVVTLVWPAITALALLYMIAIWAFLVGCVQIVTAVRLRHEIEHEWALGIAGVLSVALAVLLVITPGAGALVITWAIGWYAVILGVLLLVLAWEVRRETQHPGTSVWPGTPHAAT